MTPQARMDDEGETTKRTKGDTEAHEARRGIQSPRAQRPQRGARAWPAQDCQGETTKRTKGDTEAHEGKWGGSLG